MSADSIPCILRQTALAHPEAIAVRDGVNEISYRDLDAIVCTAEHRLSALSVREGEAVAILSLNSLAYAASIFALIRIGAIAVPLNLRWPESMLNEAIGISHCPSILSDRDHQAVAGHFGIRCLPIEDLIGEPADVGDSRFDDSRIAVPEDRVADIIFTSGSSGAPKGVKLTFGNHYHNALSSNENISFGIGDCWLASLPFCHVGGMAILFRAALSGGTVRVCSRWNPEEAGDLVDSGGLSHVSVVPTMLDALVNARSGRPFPSSLKAILVGGAPAASDVLQSAVALAAPVRTSYGMTEAASQISTLPVGFPLEKLSSSGKPLSCCEVAIFNEQSRAASAGVAGEIAVRGKSVFAGYVVAQGNQAFDRDGWFLTGDMGELDSDGYLYVHGRKDDMIISGGENIHPEQIERAVASFPGISECAVIGIDYPMWGRRPALYYTSAQAVEPSEDELQEYLRRHLSPLFIPDRIVRIDSMPRTAIGKIDKAALRRTYGRDESR